METGDYDPSDRFGRGIESLKQQQDKSLNELRFELREWMSRQRFAVEEMNSAAKGMLDTALRLKPVSGWTEAPPPTPPATRLCKEAYAVETHAVEDHKDDNICREIDKYASPQENLVSGLCQPTWDSEREEKPRRGSSKLSDGGNDKVSSRKKAEKNFRRTSVLSKTPEELVVLSSPTMGSAFRDFVTSLWFDYITIAVLFVNVIFIGVQTQVLFSGPAPLWVEVIDIIFCCLFVTELGVRMWAHGINFWINEDERRWNWFDSFVVSAQAVDTFLSLVFRGENAHVLFGNLSLLRTVRIVRMTRILRVVRMLRFLRDLRVLMASILSTMRTAIFANLLLLMCLYIFGVAVTQIVAEHALLEDSNGTPLDPDEAVLTHFGSLFTALLTLFMAITNGIDWREVIAPLMTISPIAVLFFIMYIVLMTLCVLNVLTGIFCQRAIETAQGDKENILRAQMAENQRYLRTMTDLLQDWNDGCAGLISFEQFEKFLLDEQSQALLRSLEIEVRDAYVLFEMCDSQKVGAVALNEFVTSCFTLRGSAKACHVEQLGGSCAKMARKIDRVSAKVDLLVESATCRQGRLPSSSLRSKTHPVRHEERQEKKHNDAEHKGENGIDYVEQDNSPVGGATFSVLEPDKNLADHAGV
jgi:voltage-gated sodium channel